jgi:hypothetical protein
VKNFELLFDLIADHPGLNIALIDDGSYDCEDKLVKFCQSINAKLYIKSLIPRNHIHGEALHVEEFKFTQERYNKQALQYDFLFICANIEDIKDMDSVANKIYRALKNAANLFLVVNKNMQFDFCTILEKSNFVALNTIDLNDEVNVVSAKKMHGWTKV